MFRSQRRHGRAGCVGVELLEPRVALRASALMMPIADVYDEGLRWGGAELHATSEAFTPDPDPTNPFFADSTYPPRTPGVRPFADSPYPPRMRNAPIVNRAFCQDEFPSQANRLRGGGE